MLNASRYAKNPLSVTDSTISIAELLDYVNNYFPDILPESVLRHYGYDSRPDGKLGENALFSKQETTSVYDTMDETERIRKENEKLKADVERLKERLKPKDNVIYRKEDLEQVNPQLYKWLRTFNSKSSNNSVYNFNTNVKENLSERDTTLYDIVSTKNRHT